MTTLSGRAGRLDIELEEGAHWNTLFLHLDEDATDENGDPEPFASGTTGYITIRPEIGGTAVLQLGPAAASLDGTVTITAATGRIQVDLDPLESVDLDLPGNVGVWDLIIYPGGVETDAYALLRGSVSYVRRVSNRPAAS